ncbi:hypothetical protein [Zunongwangia sp. HGR-M22]|uniref:hypothetical protein n=1 Tax=Zunongwangia sp. HGR-M22 TaxID=3015168 RepID=UPI0022DDE4EB|nr:hypothetical protein [Zunongwangia sp. HGR-M22]WBL26599.1 hypothetical protein PBT91_04845 [Zunongwangia sp. HGR-M22]
MNAYQLPVYQKALEIFKLSSAVSSYFSNNSHVLEMEISSIPAHNYAGRLVTESLQLAPGIAGVITARTIEVKKKRIERIKNAAKRIKSNCRSIEITGIKETEFLDLLRKEIHHFEHLVSDWLHQEHK